MKLPLYSTILLTALASCVTARAANFGSVSANSAAIPVFEGFTQPVQEIRVAAGESGRVDSVSVKRGSKVATGQQLMKLDTHVLQATRAVAQAKAKSTSRVDALRIDWKVKQDRFQKLQSIQKSGAGSADEVARARAESEIAQLEIEAAIEQQRLAALEMGEIDARIEQRLVRSPIAGVVTEVKREPGEYVSLSEPQVATIVRLDQLRVTFFVPTHFTQRLQISQPLALRLPNESNPEKSTAVSGVIEHVGAITQADSARVRLDVLIDNRDGALRSGVRCLLNSE